MNEWEMEAKETLENAYHHPRTLAKAVIEYKYGMKNKLAVRSAATERLKGDLFATFLFRFTCSLCRWFHLAVL